MVLSDLGIWEILGIISIISLIVSWRKRNAIWGGLTFGAFIGLIIAIFYVFSGNGFNWKIIAKGSIIGILLGVFAELLGKIADGFKRKIS
ncbi:MAG: hypothetical protein KAS53_01785 [Candidatus Cloacimonetes bacterium]|nr:hypothetical protein [Candidatus Cloacimonadota bacterium]